jgi:hypothetical protein
MNAKLEFEKPGCKAVAKPVQDRAVRRAKRHSERSRLRYEDRMMASNPPKGDAA